MDSLLARLAINTLIALFVLLVPLFSGNPITWWNIGGFVAVYVITFVSQRWYTKKKRDTAED
ncbi:MULTISPECIES: hypothetical protein [Bacteria]|uniref:Uncharacterized protein n=1 Tax=Microbacterium phage Min1 TaxID=446529 RepID=A6N223_9CAUD|nr:hypothetical protein MPMin1_gp65 [Microbacterium phage Min1]ABR10495.1 hypothetical protein [Microbacterium phage Min1]